MKRSAVAQRRECVFCHAPKLSKEHVIPQWVREVLLGLDTSAGTPFVHTSDSGSSVRSWAKNYLDFTVKRVCRDCNHGWMNLEIEKPARQALTAMIQGRSITLTPQDQEHVAAWTLKTHMMAQYRHTPTRHVVPEQLRWLSEHKRAPPKSRVWLAGYAGQPPGGAWGRTYHFRLYSPDVVGAGHVFDAEMMTLRIGHLVIQTFKWSGPIEEFRMDLPSGILPFLASIWPINDSITWPSTWVLDNEESLANFAAQFVKTGEPPNVS